MVATRAMRTSNPPMSAHHRVCPGTQTQMGAAQAKRIYTQRAAMAECVNAIARGPWVAAVSGAGSVQGEGGRDVLRARPQPHAGGGARCARLSTATDPARCRG